MKQIPLTRGMFALVDDVDFEKLSQTQWHPDRRGNKSYAIQGNGKRKIYMHRIVANAPDGMEVDHINNDGLDNRRENLRVCTRSENMRNRTMKSNSISGFKGVCRTRNNKWQAQIGINGTNVYLGTFATPEEAAKAYDKVAKEKHGEFASLNFEGTS